MLLICTLLVFFLSLLWHLKNFPFNFYRKLLTECCRFKLQSPDAICGIKTRPLNSLTDEERNEVHTKYM